MPALNLSTNVPVDAVVASDILKDCTKTLAKIIGKPESYVMISLNGGVPMAFAGSEEPAAYGEVISIGGLGPSVNGKLSSALAEILETKLSIDSSRFYIKFYDVQILFSAFQGINQAVVYSCRIGNFGGENKAPISALMARHSNMAAFRDSTSEVLGDENVKAIICLHSSHFP